MGYPDTCERCGAPLETIERDVLDLTRLGPTSLAIEWRSWWLCRPCSESIRGFLLGIDPLGAAGEQGDPSTDPGRAEEPDDFLAGIFAGGEVPDP